MGQTQWKSRKIKNSDTSNIKRKNKIKETFDNKHGFTKLPILKSVHEGFQNSEESILRDNVDLLGNIKLDNLNRKDLADEEFEKVLEEAKLTELINMIKQLATEGRIGGDDSNYTSEHCNDMASKLGNVISSKIDDSVEVENNDDNTTTDYKKTAAYTRGVLTIITNILTYLPKIVFVGVASINYAIKKLTVLYCDIMSRTNDSSQQYSFNDDLKIVFGEVDKALYMIMVFIISYNWFFIFFFYENKGNTYEYVSNANDINILGVNFGNNGIKNFMPKEKPSLHEYTWGGWLKKEVLSTPMYVMAMIQYIFLEHSDKTSFTIPNMLQTIMSFNGNVGTFDILNSLPVKWVVTLVLVYFSLEPISNALKKMVGMDVSISDTSSIIFFLFMGFISLFYFLGYIEYFVGPWVYLFLQDIMNPKDTEQPADEAIDAVTKVEEELQNKILDKAESLSFSAKALQFITFIFTIFLRTISATALYSYTTLFFFVFMIFHSFGSVYTFGKENIDKINEKITAKVTSCFTMKDRFSNLMAFANKYLLSIMLLIFSISTLSTYNDIKSRSLQSSLKTTVVLVIISILLYAIGYIDGSFAKNYIIPPISYICRTVTFWFILGIIIVGVILKYTTSIFDTAVNETKNTYDNGEKNINEDAKS